MQCEPKRILLSSESLVAHAIHSTEIVLNAFCCDTSSSKSHFGVDVEISQIPMTRNCEMSTQKLQFRMDVDDSESDTFLSKPISTSIHNKRKPVSKLALLGWVAAAVQFAIICYGWVYPPKPTDLECTQQLNAWCKY